MWRGNAFHFRLPILDNLTNGPAISAPCCRKCRRELIIQLYLQGLQQCQDVLASTSTSSKSSTRGASLKHIVDCLNADCASLDADCLDHYRSICDSWVTKPAEEDGGDSVKPGGISIRSLLSSIPFQLVGATTTDTAEPTGPQFPAKPSSSGSRTRNLLSNILPAKGWTPLLCPHCGVWLNPDSACRCSPGMECFPCTLSRWKSLQARATSLQQMSNDGSRTARPPPKARQPARKRSQSLPTLSFRRTPRGSFQKAVEAYTDTAFRFGSSSVLSRFTSSSPFLFVPSFEEVSSSLTDIIEGLIPVHLRHLPPTHYVLFFHGLYGHAKDYARFRNHLLQAYSDIHCFIPDNYSTKAMSGVHFITSLIVEYLFRSPPHAWGLGRLPSTSDLLKHILPSPGSSVAPKCIEGEPVRSQIYVSVIGHSLGGIIARSVVDVEDWISPKSKFRSLDSSSSFFSFSRFSRRQSSCPIARPKPGVGEVIFANFATFASPHNGTFEDFGGLHAVSYLVQTGRDLMTASTELQRLANHSTLLSLSKFRNLTLYGNVNGDYLVGPFTSLAINPHGHRRGSQQVPIHTDGEEPCLEFPLCVRTECHKYPRRPIEIDKFGFIVPEGEDDNPVRASAACDDASCVHLPMNVPKKRSRLALRRGRKVKKLITREKSMPILGQKAALDSQSASQPADDLTNTIVCYSPDYGMQSDSQVAGSIRFPSPAMRDPGEDSDANSDSWISQNSQRTESQPGNPMLHVAPLHHIRHFQYLPWRRFGVHIPSMLRAHACIIWHGRVDVWNLGEPIVQHFVGQVFEHPLQS